MFLSYSTTVIRPIRSIRVRIETSRGLVFIFVYRLAMDAKTRKCDGVAGRKYPSLLEGFTDGHIINGSYETSCINRKGFLLFLSYSSHRTGIRSIRPIRGRKGIQSKAVYPVIIYLPS